MDTKYDFITPEFLHLLFFQQKNLVIYPYVDLKHLRGLEVFTVGYNLIDLESTALYDIKEVISSDISSDTHAPNFYLIYNLNKEKAKDLLELKDVHCILNVNQTIKDLLPETNETFIFYNKKTNKFLNYSFENVDLKLEQIIISISENIEMLRGELQNIKNSANQLFIELNKDPESINLSKILNRYHEHEYPKIFEITEKFYGINIPDDILEDMPRFARTTPKVLDFSPEFNAIVDRNKKLREEFIQLLHEYRIKHVNESNLELRELYSPQLLYTYLRKHHWAQGIPQEFFEEWIQMKQTKKELWENDFLDFEEMLVNLKIPQKTISSILSNHKNKRLNENDVQDPIIPPQNANNDNLEINKKNNIPPTSDFALFEKWILSQLDEIEAHINGKVKNTGPQKIPTQLKGISNEHEHTSMYSFILDGSNIARDNHNSQIASIGDVIKCREKLHDLGIPKQDIFIVFGAGLHHHIPSEARGLYELLLAEHNVNQAPAERDDDWFIIQYALKHDSYIITNDRFLDYRKKCPQHEQFLKSHSIRYSIIGNEIIFEERFQEKLRKIRS